jgi:hypothetical protein
MKAEEAVHKVGGGMSLLRVMVPRGPCVQSALTRLVSDRHKWDLVRQAGLVATGTSGTR